MNHVKHSLRPWTGPFSMLILSCAALSAQEVPAGIAVLPEDGQQASTRSGEPLPQFRILETKVTQLADRTLTVHRVADPGLPALTLPPPSAPRAVLRPPLTPAQLAARPAARPAAREIRILSLSVTRYADNLSYIEWWPHGGGPPLGAWSNADYGALRMVPDFEVSPGEITYLLFPFSITPSPLRPGQGPVA